MSRAPQMCRLLNMVSRCVVGGLLSVVTTGALPTPEIGQPASKPTAARSIADALCGRSSAPLGEQTLSKALDQSETRWRRSDWPWAAESNEKLRAWLVETECTNATTAEKQQFHQRIGTLLRLQRRLEQNDAVAAALNALLEHAPTYDDVQWPSSCAPCGALRDTIDTILAALRTNDGKFTAATGRIGDRLRPIDRLAPPLSTLCPERLSAREDASAAQSRFAYFTWTQTGGTVRAFVDALFLPAIESGCR